MQITWFGHSNFRIDFDGKSLFIDPFFEGNPSAPIGYDKAGRADLVLVTHDHGDHVGQAVELAREGGAPLVGVFDTVQKLAGLGLPAEFGVGMNIGGTVEQLGIRIKMVQAMHSSASGAATGYILTFPSGFTLYHAGDTGLFQSMALFAEFHDIDLALLPVGGWFTMDPEQAAYACKLLRCKRTIPMHWGTFPILEQNTDGYAAALQKHAPGTELLVLEPGKPTEID
ncbi:MAG: metal-dependent hydrolase [Desulfovibrionaceae bacterium]